MAGQTKLRVLGFMILAVQIGVLFAYGFAGKFAFISNAFSQAEKNILPLYFYMSLFAVGMGLVLSFFRGGTALGLGTAIFAIAITTQLSPLFQKFWFNVFVDEFGRQTASGSTNTFIVLQELEEVRLSAFIFRISMATTISYLISALATIGRTGIFEQFTSLLVFNVMWPIPFYCNIRLYLRNAPNSLSLFDDFGLTYIYTFAGFFGLIYGCLLNARARDTNLGMARTSSAASIMSIFGTTIVFATLPTTLFIFPILGDAERYNSGFFNMYLAQFASMIIAVAVSILLGKKRLNIETVMISILSGGAICAQFISGESNLGPALAIGAFGGLFTGIYMQLIHPKINRTSVKDALGLIGAVLIPSFLGGVIVAPVTYRVYIDEGYQRITGLINDSEVIRFNFVYYFITVGAAIVAGLIAGIFALCTNDHDYDFEFRKVFKPDFGLCRNGVEILEGAEYDRSSSEDKRKESAERINNSD